MDKKALRAEMKQKRGLLTLRERERAGADVLRQLIALPAFRRAKTLFCYAAYGDELPTDPIAAYAKAQGKQVAYPKVLPDRRMIFLTPARSEPGFQGILEPAAGEVRWPEAHDFMLLPGLAFTPTGGRLGYGGGYYDRYLAALAQRPVCCGVGFSFQLISELPQEPHDQRLDLVITAQI